jgi:hypothetical protein
MAMRARRRTIKRATLVTPPLFVTILANGFRAALARQRGLGGDHAATCCRGQDSVMDFTQPRLISVEPLP